MATSRNSNEQLVAEFWLILDGTTLRVLPRGYTDYTNFLDGQHFVGNEFKLDIGRYYHWATTTSTVPEVPAKDNTNAQT